MDSTMTEDSAPLPGTIAWHDLTVGNADVVRDFYAAVVGWKPSPVAMGDYSDYSMIAKTDEAVAGVCHAMGDNEALPAQWLMYVIVENLESSLAECRHRGGKVLHGPREIHSSLMAVIEDPAGAVCALYQPAQNAS